VGPTLLGSGPRAASKRGSLLSQAPCGKVEQALARANGTPTEGSFAGNEHRPLFLTDQARRDPALPRPNWLRKNLPGMRRLMRHRGEPSSTPPFQNACLCSPARLDPDERHYFSPAQHGSSTNAWRKTSGPPKYPQSELADREPAESSQRVMKARGPKQRHLTRAIGTSPRSRRGRREDGRPADLEKVRVSNRLAPPGRSRRQPSVFREPGWPARSTYDAVHQPSCWRSVGGTEGGAAPQ